MGKFLLVDIDPIIISDHPDGYLVNACIDISRPWRRGLNINGVAQELSIDITQLLFRFLIYLHIDFTSNISNVLDPGDSKWTKRVLDLNNVFKLNSFLGSK